MTNDSPFDAAVALRPQADGTFIGNTSAAYGNMVGPFDGVTAARALAQRMARELAPRGTCTGSRATPGPTSSICGRGARSSDTLWDGSRIA